MRKPKKSEDIGFNIWRSYSDMMAGVLLLFVLIMCVTMFMAQKSYDESIKERDDKIAMQEQYTSEILAQQSELDEKNAKLSDQDEQLSSQAQTLAEQAKELAAQQETLNAQEVKLNEQEQSLAAAQASIDEKTQQLAAQQQQIDQIIGVKADVVAALKTEFENNNVNVDIDSKTGAMTLEAAVMFDYDDAELTEEGKAALDQVLPIYCKVLLQEKYKDYLAEIIIDGYTDTQGDYSYNLELSQKRSLAVAQYLIEIQNNFLNSDEITSLESYLTVNGHSMANPVLDENGNVDEDASRRVEVKFRLKDEEMISDLNNIMSSTEADAETETTTAAQ